jgi:transposase
MHERPIPAQRLEAISQMPTVACNIGRIAVVLDGMDLTDAQWAVLEPTFRPRRRPDGRGRPWSDPRAVMNGVLWVLRTGAPWHDLPSRYPPYQTCHRRFQLWQRSGRLDRLLQYLAEDLRDRSATSRTTSEWCSSPVPASCFGPQSDSLRRPDGSTVGDLLGSNREIACFYRWGRARIAI